MKRYTLLWRADCRSDGIDRADIPEGFGACDAMLFGPIVRGDDGSASYSFFSLDGTTKEKLDDGELFKSWMMLASQLAESKTLGEGRRMLAFTTFELVKDAINGRPNALMQVVGAAIAWREDPSSDSLAAKLVDAVDALGDR